ncbi:MAG TPA: hypothetical protein VGO57_02215 [Verrucomicrobiae bacterium]|jgi:hypothetical protein
MSTQPKPRADAKLKTLPPERQADIFAKLNLPVKQGGGYAETLKWLKDDGLETSLGALSQFFSWYSLKQQMERNESTVETLLEKVAAANTGLSPERIQELGQSFFTAMALEQQDPKAWYLTQQVGLKKEQLLLDRKKFQRETIELFIKWAQDKQALDLATSKQPKSVKMDALGQKMFGDLW